MAQGKRLGRLGGGHAGCRQAAVEHSDLTEKVTRLQPLDWPPVDGYLDLAIEQDVEGIGRLALDQKRLAGGKADLIDAGGEEFEFPLGAVRKQRDRLQSVGLSLHACSLRY